MERSTAMKTIFDVLTMSIFAGLVVLFLKRSVGAEKRRDSMWQYLVAATGCAVANYWGNHGFPIMATLLITAVLMFIQFMLKPFV
jgi:uncharacterized membrane protein YjjP (DUF1212 family)